MNDHRRSVRALWLLVGLACIVRLGYGLAFVDLDRAYYWEYGELAKNLHAGNGYALFHSLDGRVTFLFDPHTHPFPSAYMPPGYVAFLYPFIAIENVHLRSVLLLVMQALLGGVVVGLVYILTRRHVRADAALIAASITAFLPEFIYATGSYTPTVIYHVLILLFLLGLYAAREDRRAPWRWLPALVLTSIALIFVRAESAGLVLLAVIFIARVAGVRRAVIFTALVGIGYAPWVVRNTVVFGRPVILTTSGGLNLFRGHNPEGRAAWSDDILDARLARVPLDSAYEPNVDALYRTRVGELVVASPWEEAVGTAKKVLFLWLADPGEPLISHPLYIIPWILILIVSLHGARTSVSAGEHLPVLMVLFYSTCMAALFFVLPRYQTMMKVALIPLAAAGVRDLWFRFIDFPRQIS